MHPELKAHTLATLIAPTFAKHGRVSDRELTEAAELVERIMRWAVAPDVIIGEGSASDPYRRPLERATTPPPEHQQHHLSHVTPSDPTPAPMPPDSVGAPVSAMAPMAALGHVPVTAPTPELIVSGEGSPSAPVVR
jgi:hypothetical protein